MPVAVHQADDVRQAFAVEHTRVVPVLGFWQDVIPTFDRLGLQHPQEGVVRGHLKPDDARFADLALEHMSSLYSAALRMTLAMDDIATLKRKAQEARLKAATSTTEDLRRIMGALDLAYEPRQLQWAEQVKHNVGGNPIRFKASATLQLDERWKDELTLAQQWWIDLKTCSAQRRNQALLKASLSESMAGG